MPGVDHDIHNEPGRGPGFNEAGAIMPRSGLRVHDGAHGNRGFNEAGAIMPRSGYRRLSWRAAEPLLQ